MRLEHRGFVPAVYVAGNFFPPLFWRFPVWQHKFGSHDLDVAHRLDAARDVRNVRVLEATHDLHQGIHFANMAEELVPETFPARRAFDQPGDIHELEGGWDEVADLGNFAQRFQPRVGHAHYPKIRLNGAEGVVLSRGFVRPGDGIEKRGFPDIGQSND